MGLVKNTKYGDLREELDPIAFLSIAQEPRPATGAQFLIRSNLPQSEITNSVRRVLGEINPAITIQFLGFKTMIEENLLRDRLMATLSGFFGVLALLLASIGLYGILSYGVASQRRRSESVWPWEPSPRSLSLVMREALVLG